ncbi:hypothetical protein TH66_19485 [Carbonactinospora thermoautotrophica]|uniref:HTH cro/C1-type domain-containing protein n=2 Tax=Carbonactinospora thermoautotrophica TaxID=1469144 RepID=A0A132NEI5_9ACTN|nr:hypothetical protein TH66_19485 [Carbonactinospora thermoautotrophica]KWX08470.1 hypothetical protein TR74_14840 [Carbonactinospora thermoautotrophica]
MSRMEVPPTVRQRLLGARLRRLREAAGMTLDQAGQVIECTGSKISRIETGHRGIKPFELRHLLRAYGVTDEARIDAFVRAFREAKRRDWWDTGEYDELLSEAQYRDYLTLEADAAWIRNFESLLVPGLLQTEDYARAVIAAYRTEDSSDQIDALVKVRMARQEAVLRQPKHPVKLWAVLDEAVLRRPWGGRDVMRAQLRHLAEIGSTRGNNITIQVLPFKAGDHPAVDGSFVLLSYPEQIAPDIVWLEIGNGSLYLENTADVERYNLMFSHLTARALSPPASVEFIARAAEEL